MNLTLYCPTCELHKMSTQGKHPMVVDRTGFQFERINMDLISPLPGSDKDMKIIMVVIDHFSKHT